MESCPLGIVESGFTVLRRVNFSAGNQHSLLTLRILEALVSLLQAALYILRRSPLFHET